MIPYKGQHLLISFKWSYIEYFGKIDNREATGRDRNKIFLFFFLKLLDQTLSEALSILDFSIVSLHIFFAI
jgi:hypothetical protein